MSWKFNYNYQEKFKRNIGLVTTEEQDIIGGATVGIAGVGADGGLVAERIARLGVKKIKIADPDYFEASNINRQYSAGEATIGKKKVEVIARELQKISNDMIVEVFDNGITQQNARDFVQGCDVLVDEIEYTLPQITSVFHREGMAKGITIFSGLNLGFGINIFRFTPNSVSYEKIARLISSSSYSEGFNLLTLVPNVPPYVSKEVINQVLAKKIPIPSISPTIGLLSGYLSFYVLGHLINKWTLDEVPRFLSVDMLTQKTEIKTLHV